MLKNNLERVLRKIGWELGAGLRSDVAEIRKDVAKIQSELARDVSEIKLQIFQMRLDQMRDAVAARETQMQARFKPLLDKMGRLHEDLEEVASLDLPLAVDRFDRMWKLKEKRLPYSCSDEEGIVMYHLITSNRLTSGFEIATAFGFSAAYIGAGFEVTGGSLVTMDCYVEESKGSDHYSAAEMEVSVREAQARVARGEIPLGMAIAERLSGKLGLGPVVEFAVGLSPQDVPSTLQGRQIDFAFIDGGHHGDQPLQDLRAVAPFLADRCAVLFHDNYPGFEPVGAAVREAERLLGCNARRLPTRNHLTLVARGLNPDTLAALDQVVGRSALALV